MKRYDVDFSEIKVTFYFNKVSELEKFVYEVNQDMVEQ